MEHNADQQHLVQLEHRLRELIQERQQLRALLDMLLATLDTSDISTVFDHTLTQVSDCFGAEAAWMYLVDDAGFILRAATRLVTPQMRRTYLSYEGVLGSFLKGLTKSTVLDADPTWFIADVISGHTVQQVSDGSENEVRRTLSDTSTDTSMPVSESCAYPQMRECARLSKQLFSSRYVAYIPMFFGETAVALLVLALPEAPSHDTSDLFDAAAHVLSFQLASAIQDSKYQHMRRLDMLKQSLLSSARQLCNLAQIEAVDVYALWMRVASELKTHMVILRPDPESKGACAYSHLGLLDTTISFDQLYHAMRECGRGVQLFELSPASLHDLGFDRRTVAVVCASVWESRPFLLLLQRQEDLEPLTQGEIDFLRSLVDEMRVELAGRKEQEDHVHIAQALQMGMQHTVQQVEGLAASAYYSSATESAHIGGDFYDLIRIPHNRACIIMGDVAGKGIEAASLASAVKTACAAYAWEESRPERIVKRLNTFLWGFGRLESFVSLFVGIYDEASATLEYCSAGHPPALFLESATQHIITLDVQSGIIGAFESMSYTAGMMSFAAQDTLVLYTDGTTEARSPSGEFFGEVGLRELVMDELSDGKDFQTSAERMFDRLDTFAQHKLIDDVALLLIRKL